MNLFYRQPIHSLTGISNQVQSIVITNCPTSNQNVFFQNYPSLEFFIICSDCFMNVQSMTIRNCRSLKKFIVGDNCFKDPTQQGVLSVQSCEKLEYIEVGCDSFVSYTLCEMKSRASYQALS